ncbi:hypothetical protein SDC9_200169 [bioreactor metagenome]|uniref:Uncharacterized protein n=1 Tax=bioreactor metagenome TaxID=1076179 RepID=A0A645IML9_9ZZZZ
MFARDIIYLSPALIYSKSLPSDTMIALSFLLGAASASALIFLIALMVSIAISSFLTSSSNVSAVSKTGQLSLIKKLLGFPAALASDTSFSDLGR